MATVFDGQEEEVLLAEVEEPAGIQVPPGGSLIDAIRKRQDEIEADHFYDMHLPKYGGLVVLRLAPIRGAKLTQLRERLEKSKDPERDFALNADVLISCCRQILGREHPGEELRTVDPDGVSEVRLDQHFAELLGFETNRARDLVRFLFRGAPSPELALGVAMGEFIAWAQGAGEEVEEELLGEA